MDWIFPTVLLASFIWLIVMAWRRRHLISHRGKFAAEVIMKDYQAQSQQAAMIHVMEQRERKIEEDSGDTVGEDKDSKSK